MPEPEKEPTTNKIKPTEDIIEDFDGVSLTKHKVDVYDMGDYPISIEKGHKLSFEEVKRHIDNLPSELTKDMTLKGIKILNKTPNGVAGDYSPVNQMITIYAQSDSNNMLNTLTHELAHAKDFKFNSRGILENTLSHPDNWEKIWKADNKANVYTRPNGKKRTPKIFPTDYAGKSWLKFKKGKTDVEKARRFQEDVAESHALYFNTDLKVREDFIKKCPNRAKYLEELYGKPKFSKSTSNDISKSTGTKSKSTKTTITEPTEAQLKKNLTKNELEEYKWAKGVLEKDFIKEKGKAIARAKLDELTKKALGTSETSAKTTPKTTKTGETTVKPKESSTPKTVDARKMSSQELYESMTKADKKKYDKIKKTLDNVNKNIESIGESEILLDMKKKNLLELRKLEEKQINKLNKKNSPRKPKKTERLYERTLDKIHDEISIPTEKLIPKLEKWITKRCKNTSEFGYNFNTKTGELIGDEIRGVKGHVGLRDLGKGTGTIHSHPRNGMAVPSVADLESFRCEKGNHHFMVAEHEIWYVEATDSFGIGAMGQQLDLQKAHKECQDRAFETVSKLIKEGKVEATEESIAEALNKYTGDEILKTFNSPPWNKTMTVKRYYR